MADAWRRKTAKPIDKTANRRTLSGVEQYKSRGINPNTASISDLGSASAQMAAVVSLLQSRPHTMKELTAGLALRCSYSASTALREAYAQVSILTACDRVQRVGPTVELK